MVIRCVKVSLTCELKFLFAEYCLKSVCIRSFPDPYLSLFGLNTERYKVSLRIQSECGKIWTRKTPNKDTFYAVEVLIHSLKPCLIPGW